MMQYHVCKMSMHVFISVGDYAKCKVLLVRPSVIGLCEGISLRNANDDWA